MPEYAAECDARRARWLAAADVVRGSVIGSADDRVLDGVLGRVVQVFVPDVTCDHPGIEHAPFSYTGVCPGCGVCKFIGHGPLCWDCYTRVTSPGERA